MEVCTYVVDLGISSDNNYLLSWFDMGSANKMQRERNAEQAGVNVMITIFGDFCLFMRKNGVS
jgi:hypothetical protein